MWRERRWGGGDPDSSLPAIPAKDTHWQPDTQSRPASPGCTHAGSLQMTCFYREGQLHAMLEAPARPTHPRPDPFIVWSCTRINPTVSACGGAEGPEEGGLVSRLVLDSVFSFLIFTANYI